MTLLDDLVAKDLLPDPLLRLGIRHLLQRRLRDEVRASPDEQRRATAAFVAAMNAAPIALQTAAANEQHYEVPAEFFTHCLGPRMKYSSGLWNDGTTTLAEAEVAMLELTCARAGIAHGQDILELGCGWGSLSLWMAERFPRSRILAVSNSRSQKEYIERHARALRLANLRVVTCDMNDLSLPPESFDRVVSVEMFEHMRNWEMLLERIDGWLRPHGRLFVHIFTHRVASYAFEARDDTDWMSRYFFTGGMMPSADLMAQFDRHLGIEEQWSVSGIHYARTAEAWLQNMDRNRATILPILARTYGQGQAGKWWAYWRVFFLACAQLWGYRRGEEWGVSHYRLAKVAELAASPPLQLSSSESPANAASVRPDP
jgi:cyclopropane-fatty-acyl-phospholipid synthase